MLLGLVVSVGGVILYYMDRGNTLAQPDLLVAVILWGIFVLMLLAERLGAVGPVMAALLTITLAATILLPFIPGSQTNLLYFAVVPVLLAGIFVGPLGAAASGAIMIAGVLALAWLEPRSSFVSADADPTPMIVYLIVVTALILVYAAHSRQLEIIRRRQLEGLVASLRESELRLEERVRERTAELESARRDAESARDRALEADRFKTQFMAIISHELRTPLNALINFTQFVSSGLKGPVNPEQRDMLEKATLSGRQLLALINDILDIFRIEADSLQLAMEDSVDLRPILQQVMTTAEGLVAHKPIAISLEMDDQLPLLRLDARRAHQMILNLVSNACRFTESGSIVLTARRAGGEVLITVTDTGPGIDPADHELIFESFRQTRHGLRVGRGSGLGLPIARHLAQAHNGRLWLDSAPGRGSTFTVALPIPAPPADPA